MDADGFPVALLRIRDEVTRRGGMIAPDGHRGVIYHDDSTLARIHIYFHHDGWVEIGVTRHCIFLRSPDDAYSAVAEYDGHTEFEAAVFDILDGGFGEYVLLDADDAFRGAGFHLDTPPARRPPISHDDGLRVAWWTYPPWPQPRS